MMGKQRAVTSGKIIKTFQQIQHLKQHNPIIAEKAFKATLCCKNLCQGKRKLLQKNERKYRKQNVLIFSQWCYSN